MVISMNYTPLVLFTDCVWANEGVDMDAGSKEGYLSVVYKFK